MAMLEPLQQTCDYAEMSLEALAEIANSEHGLAMEAAAATVGHAIYAGAALNEARERLGYGEFGSWVDSHFNGSRNNAQMYRRLAHYASMVSQFPSINEARKYLVKHQLELPRPERLPDRRNEARALRARSYTNTEIADVMGVSRQFVHQCFLDSRTLRQRKSAQARRTRQARAALRRLERDALARAVSGDLGEAYSRTRLLAEILEGASSAETDPDAKAAIASAMHSLYRVEDQINKALGTSDASKKT